MLRTDAHFPMLNDPLNADRNPGRMLFDFGAMLACFVAQPVNRRVLDFCAGSCWISEWLNRMGHEVWAIDLHTDGTEILRLRAGCDQRVDLAALTYNSGDAHHLPYEDGFFGHICCFDSLHHMYDYERTLREMARVLAPGGRAVFVEPGASHSKAPETIAAVREKNDPAWIERDVVLEEIDALARAAGFAPLVIRPMLPANYIEYPLDRWQAFRKGDNRLAMEYLDALKRINYDDHLVFYLHKPLDAPPR